MITKLFVLSDDSFRLNNAPNSSRLRVAAATCSSLRVTEKEKVDEEFMTWGAKKSNEMMLLDEKICVVDGCQNVNLSMERL